MCRHKGLPACWRTEARWLAAAATLEALDLRNDVLRPKEPESLQSPESLQPPESLPACELDELNDHLVLSRQAGSVTP